MSEEVCQVGWESLARMFQKTPETMYQHRHEMKAAGVIWYQRPGKAYRSPNGKAIRRPMVHFFPSRVVDWWIEKCKTMA